MGYHSEIKTMAHMRYHYVSTLWSVTFIRRYIRTTSGYQDTSSTPTNLKSYDHKFVNQDINRRRPSLCISNLWQFRFKISEYLLVNTGSSGDDDVCADITVKKFDVFKCEIKIRQKCCCKSRMHRDADKEAPY